MFEDAQGKEVVNIQAQKDLTELVKNDATVTVKNDRTTTVWKNDSSLVGVKYDLNIATPGQGAPARGPTTMTMEHERIEFTTGQASIVLQGANIAITANGNITMTAGNNIGINAVTLPGSSDGGGEGPSKTIVVFAEKVVQIDGPEAVFINCTEAPPSPMDESSWVGTAVAVASVAGPIALAIGFPVVGAGLLGASLIGSWLSS